MSTASYRFLPWVRQGLASTVDQGASPPFALDSAVKVSVRLWSDTAYRDVPVRLYGPGDITGIDARQVVRTVPGHLTTDFLPNHFPSIEFDRPDFPWLFTPAKPNAAQQQWPWLSLVVIKKQDGVKFEWPHGKPLPTLTIAGPAVPYLELPDLSEAYAWAHSQVAEPTAANTDSITSALTGDPLQNLSRLICPRKLEPNTPYIACVVPTFRAGVLAGLGADPAESPTLTPAWAVGIPEGSSPPASVVLPVYYHWEFATAESGDFASLARRLAPRPIPPEVGSRAMDVSHPGYGIPAAGTPIGLEGVLRVPGAPPTPWSDSQRLPFQTQLMALLNQPAIRIAPVVAPPIYGEWQSGRNRVTGAGSQPLWLNELNLDPRHRAMAGFGALVIQQEQEHLMSAAWEQAGALRRANQLLRQAQLAGSLGESIRQWRLKFMSLQASLNTTRPLHADLIFSTRYGLTVQDRLDDSPVPPAALSGAFQRLTRPRGPLMRRMVAPNGRTLRPFLDMFNNREIKVTPPKLLPDGIVTFDAVSKSLGKNFNGVRIGKLTPEAIAAAPGWERTAPPVKPTYRGVYKQSLRREDDPDRPRKPPIPERNEDHYAMVRNFREAAKAHQAYLLGIQKLTPRITFKIRTDKLSTRLLGAILPTANVTAKAQLRIQASPEAWARAGSQLNPLTVELKFTRPMYEALRDISKDLILPGVERLPANMVTVLETNPRVVESYMAGLNHELSRELLWREFPAELWSTYFDRFWSTRPDMPPIHQWQPGKPLGTILGVTDSGKARAVFLIRGDLIRRYPTAQIFAVKAVDGPRGRTPGTEIKAPLFRGSLEPDIVFIGFDLTQEEVRGLPGTAAQGWYFVIQDQPAEPRFGQPENLTAPGGHVSVHDLNIAPNAAGTAAATLVRPVSISIHGSALTPAGVSAQLKVQCVARSGTDVTLLRGSYENGQAWQLSVARAARALEAGVLKFYTVAPDGSRTNLTRISAASAELQTLPECQ